jgi:2-aminoadipate transaminase
MAASRWRLAVRCDDLVDLGIGQPDDSLLPRELLGELAAAALAKSTSSRLQYAPEEGAESLREALADFLTLHYGRLVKADELVMTSGASHALDLVLAWYTRPGDAVAVEAPTYFLGLHVLRQRGVRLVPVPVDEHGIDADRLEEVLQRHHPRLLYLIPTFQNPTGMTLTSERRARVAALSAEYGCIVVADEVYQLTASPDRVPETMRAHAGGNVMSLGSFSKILAPGIRLGWIECAASCVQTLRKDGVLRSGGGVSPMTGIIIESALRNGVQEQLLSAFRAAYDRRRRHALDSLDRLLPVEISYRRPAGGYYVWLQLPSSLDMRAVHAEAARHGVGFRPGPLFSIDGSFEDCLRLCFAYYDEDRLAVGIGRLTDILRSRLSA